MNIMEVSMYLLTFTLSLYALDSVDLSKITKKNKIYEVRALYMLISMSLSYLSTNFIFGFIEASLIIKG